VIFFSIKVSNFIESCEMNYNVAAYLVYLSITVGVILRVGHLLFRHGRIFIVNCLHGDTVLADAINRILLIGYYLVNVGYSVLSLKIWTPITSGVQMAETLGKKIGCIVLLLGAMHLFNVTLLLISDRRRTKRALLSLMEHKQSLKTNRP
jgi:hypothetical protein